MEEAVALIKDVGFPIVAFLLMWYQSNKAIRKNTEAITEMSKLVERLCNG